MAAKVQFFYGISYAISPFFFFYLGVPAPHPHILRTPSGYPLKFRGVFSYYDSKYFLFLDSKSLVIGY